MSGVFCIGIVVTYCFLPQQEPPVDSYCLQYDQVIVEPGDSKITAPIGVKKRLLANELKFKRFCNGNSSKGN